mmetsp:Transcript_113824/g.307376  ORF Transcript_113824/g.307376 Transcript_113824/m.307376 type:complete len:211 (-) Transcript_113824:415-1047(-)
MISSSPTKDECTNASMASTLTSESGSWCTLMSTSLRMLRSQRGHTSDRASSAAMRTLGYSSSSWEATIFAACSSPAKASDEMAPRAAARTFQARSSSRAATSASAAASPRSATLAMPSMAATLTHVFVSSKLTASTPGADESPGGAMMPIVARAIFLVIQFSAVRQELTALIILGLPSLHTNGAVRRAACTTSSALSCKQRRTASSALPS